MNLNSGNCIKSNSVNLPIENARRNLLSNSHFLAHSTVPEDLKSSTSSNFNKPDDFNINKVEKKQEVRVIFFNLNNFLI